MPKHSKIPVLPVEVYNTAWYYRVGRADRNCCPASETARAKLIERRTGRHIRTYTHTHATLQLVPTLVPDTRRHIL